MKKALLALLIATASLSYGQSYTVITSTGMVVDNGSGGAVNPPSGSNLCFLGVNNVGAAITYTPAGGGPVTGPVCQTMNGTGGLSSVLQVANPATASPAGLLYTITITHSSTTYLTLPLVAISGSSFAINSYSLPGNKTATGIGYPHLACNSGAAWASTTLAYPQNSSTCQLVSGVGTWVNYPKVPLCSAGQSFQQPQVSGSPFCLAPVMQGLGAPTGACINTSIYFQVDSPGTIFGCYTAAWSLISGTGSSGLTSFNGRTTPAATLQVSDIESIIAGSPYGLNGSQGILVDTGAGIFSQAIGWTIASGTMRGLGILVLNNGTADTIGLNSDGSITAASGNFLVDTAGSLSFGGGGAIASSSLICQSSGTNCPSAATPQYQTVQNSGTNVTPRGKLNFINSTGIVAVDNSGNNSSDISLNAIPNGSLANSSITINTTGALAGGGVVALGGSITLNAPTTTGTVTSVGVAVPSWAGSSGGPITTTGVITLTLPPFVGSGASHAPGIVPDPGASAGSTRFLNENGTFSIPPSSAGTVTSVAQTVPSWLAVSGSPVTTTGTLAITAATGQTSHQVIGTCGSATSFGPCALTGADLPVATSSLLGVVRPDNSSITISGGVLSATTSGGTVTAVGCTTANGVSCTSSGGATPSLTFTLGAITPSSLSVNGSQTINGVQGTTGTKLLAATGSFSSGNLLSSDGSGNAVNSGISATNVALLNASNTFTQSQIISLSGSSSGIGLFSLIPSLGTGNSSTIYVGQSSTSLNVAQLGFTYAGSGSASNSGFLGVAGGANATFDGTGNWTFANTITSFIPGSGNTFPIQTLQPSISVGNSTVMYIGQSNSAFNVAQLGFTYAGSGSASNSGFLGVAGGANATFDGTGNWVMPGSVTAPSFSSSTNTVTLALGTSSIVGAGATFACAAGHNCDAFSGTAFLTTGTGISANGLVLSVTAATGYSSASDPNCTVVFTQPNTGGPPTTPPAYSIGFDFGTHDFTLFAATLANSTPYEIHWTCGNI